MVVSMFLEFKEFKAWVEVDQKRLRCYATLVDKKEKTVSCWIASEEEKCFSVKLLKKQEMSSTRASLFLDGNEVLKRYYKKKELGTITFKKVRTSKDTKRPFKFASLEVTDDDEYLETVLLSRDTVQKIGEITIEIHRVTHLHYKETPRKKENSESQSKKVYDTLPVQKIHERSNKATQIPHQIGYGDEEKTKRRQSPDRDSRNENSGSQHKKTYTSIRYSDVKELVARFTFRYRPIETLRSCGIAPRPVVVQLPSLLPASATQAPDTEPSRVQELELPPEPRLVHGQEVPQAQQSQAQSSEQMVCRSLSNSQLPLGHDQEVRYEDVGDDDIYVPLQPPSDQTTTIPNADANMPSDFPGGGSSKIIVLPTEDETKPDLSKDSDEDENDEEIKALQAKTEKLLAEKRKRKEAKQGPRKKIKREETPMVFFRPGEIKEVIDLT